MLAAPHSVTSMASNVASVRGIIMLKVLGIGTRLFRQGGQEIGSERKVQSLDPS